MKRIKLGELYKVQSGYAFKSGCVQDSGIPIIRIGNIKNNSVEIDDSFCYDSSFLNEEKNKNYTIKNGDLLIAMSGATTGKVGIYSHDQISLLNQRVGKFICLNEKSDNRYLYYLLQSPKFKKMISDKAVGCAQPNINNKDIEQLEIPYYEPASIQNIVEELNQLYSLINNRKQQIADLNQLLKKYFRQHYDLINETICIENVCTIKARIGWQGLTKKEYLKDGPCFLITGVDFCENRINFDNCFYVTEERYNQDENIQIHKEDVLVTKDGTIGKVAYINNEPSLPTTLNSGVFVVRVKDKSKLNSIFLEYSLMSNRFEKFIDSIKTGATISHLNQEAFLKYEIPVVGLDEQKKFVELVNNVEEQILLCKTDIRELEKMVEIKMHEYFD